MEGGWPDDSIGRASDGGALCSGHASLHVQPRTESKVDVRSPSLLTSTSSPHVPSCNQTKLTRKAGPHVDTRMAVHKAYRIEDGNT